MQPTKESINDPTELIKLNRPVVGISAVLLPFRPDGQIHWLDFERLLQRTCAAGLTPAVNMDTGFVNLIDERQRNEVLHRARETVGNQPLVAGAFVADQSGAKFDLAGYQRAIEQIHKYAATPVIFQSFGLVGQDDAAIVASYEAIGQCCEQFIAFELGLMFAAFGRIYSPEVFHGLLDIENCSGLKHSSLDRQLEWQRLVMRDRLRPDFKIFTGNDLAIDMVMYGSDYLLGLSTMAPDFFALRDKFWLQGDRRFYELNDVLQYLGNLAFRNPVPAYKHTAAMFLALRHWIANSNTHPSGTCRPETDEPILADILKRLEHFFEDGEQ